MEQLHTELEHWQLPPPSSAYCWFWSPIRNSFCNKILNTQSSCFPQENLRQSAYEVSTSLVMFFIIVGHVLPSYWYWYEKHQAFIRATYKWHGKPCGRSGKTMYTLSQQPEVRKKLPMTIVIWLYHVSR